MKKTRITIMIITLIFSIIIFAITSLLLWLVFSGRWGKNYAEYSDCQLYQEHSLEKIDLTKKRNFNSVENSFNDYWKGGFSALNLTQQDIAFIKRCEENMLYKASSQAIAQFKKQINIEHYVNLSMAKDALKNNQIYPYQVEEMIKAIPTSSEQKQFMLDFIIFLNIFTNVYGSNVLKRLLYTIEFTDSIKLKNYAFDSERTLAVTIVKKINNVITQCMIFAKNSILTEVSQGQYKNGFHVSDLSISTFIHEMGHALANYAFIWSAHRNNLFNQKITKATGTCNLENTDRSTIVHSFVVPPSQLLVQYLGRRVGISNNAKLQQFLAAWSFVQSGYGRTGGAEELFAEAFTQWILTPDDQKGLNWEVLNEFFGTYLKYYYFL